MDGAQNYYDLLAQNQHLSNTVREQQKKLRQISSFCEGIGNVLSDSVNNEQDVHSPSSYSIQSPKDIVQGTSGNTLNSLNSTHMHELDSQQSVTWNDQRTNGLVRPMVPRPSVFCLDLLRSEGAARLAYLTQSEQSPSSSIRLDSLVQKLLDNFVSRHEHDFHCSKLWWSWTSSFRNLGPITRFRIAPTPENHSKLPAWFRQSELQLKHFHWPMVDWIPFPGVRDRLILHGQDYDLTEVIVATIQSYCLEEVLESSAPHEDICSHLPLGNCNPCTAQQHTSAVGQVGQSGETYVYYRLAEYLEYQQPDQNSPHGSMQSRAIPTGLETRFIVALEFNHDDELPSKLDPNFFVRFPRLYDPDAVARGSYRSIFDTF